ncbi:EthD family reductase [Sphingomonas sp. TREG-RG-20F-R18-01]|uniref:EthD family reductase n=1 Tax=Sphingomonas sp. TREG-RG-20F-R18-01 TaxID=2914982 RepID=UPI001F586B7D|nr:EthD family reductase [Sphingomonas sp. TREG-RG-20F-R18-01]
MQSADTVDTSIIYVTYEGGPQDRFDRDYYLAHHLPLARAAYEQYGLLSLAAFFPAESALGTIAIAEFRYSSVEAAQMAFGSTEADRVRADIRNFTTLTPKRSHLMPLN